jgi:hypothetical protein
VVIVALIGFRGAEFIETKFSPSRPTR